MGAPDRHLAKVRAHYQCWLVEYREAHPDALLADLVRDAYVAGWHDRAEERRKAQLSKAEEWARKALLEEQGS